MDNLIYHLSLNVYEIQIKPFSNTQGIKTIVYTVPLITQGVALRYRQEQWKYKHLSPKQIFKPFWRNLDNTPIIDVYSKNLQSLQITYSKVYPKTSYKFVYNYIAGTQHNY